MMKKVFTFLFVLTIIVNGWAQNAGIGTTIPQSKLDVNGDLALRSGILQCIAGDNISTDAVTNKFSNYTIQLTGNGSFTINGITGGADGRIINIYNNTGFAFTIHNEYLSTPIAANRILTGSDSLVVIFPQNSVSLRYIGSLGRWLVTGSHRSDLWSYYGTNIHNANIGNVGIGVDTAKAGLHIISNNGIIAKGDTLSNNSYVLTESGAGAKLIWHPKKAAFIVGRLDNFGDVPFRWDEDSIGFGAMNLGYANKVKGAYSFATGIGNIVSGGGYGSIAMGHSNFADSNECVAIGFGTEAHARQSIAIGTGAEAWGRSSLATGYVSRSMGYVSTAGGFFSTAIGDYSFSNGYYNTAKGEHSFSQGFRNYSGAPHSFTAGIQDSVFEFTSPVGGARSATAFGWGNKVRGAFSLTAGTSNILDSAAYNSLVVGFGNTSDGNENIVLGNSNIVNSRYSVAIGKQNITGFPKYYQLGYNFSDAFVVGRGNGVNKNAMAIGFNNLIIDGDSSVVIGNNNFCGNLGINNLILGNNSWANGNYSTAIGYRASTNFKNYSVCIGASGTGATPISVANEHDNEFMIYAQWYKFWTSNSGTSVYLTPGSNAWLSTCDKNTKENFEPVNGEEVLQKLSTICLQSWNYKKQDPKTFRHYGIMAQDFYNAFGKDKYGTIGNDTAVNHIDMMGIAYSGIQALEKRTEKIDEQQQRIEALEKENADLKKRLEKLEKLILDK